MRIGVLIWPAQPWPRARETWLRAEKLGFAHAWVYDHVVWHDERVWYDAYTTLAAAAAITSQLPIGTLVTSPNFRHPVPTAHQVNSVDEISGSRFTLGIGAGNAVADAGILGQEPWSATERAERFAEWVTLLDLLLRQEETTFTGRFWSAREAVIGGQTPRVPFTIAATGPKGMRLVAKYADSWVTVGDPTGRAKTAVDAVRRQCELLDEACAAEKRDHHALSRMLLTGTTEERPLESVAAFEDYAGRYAELGITDLILHWPRAEGRFAADQNVFEDIAVRYAA
jgi:alkanesulfonate monooxygenase SsuD/methylene tetrahydromethanopterin reductase-like flavin-dependent oxidoreductase (luciferase family)